MITSRLSTLLLVALVAAPLVAMKTAFEFDDVLFDFNEVNTRARGSSPGVGKGGGAEQQPREVDITLQADDTFVAQPMVGTVPDGDPITGSYARKNEFSRRLTLIPDAAGIESLAQRYADVVAEELEDEGVSAIVSDLGLTQQNLRLIVRQQKKQGTATARLRGRLRFSGLGSVPEIGVNNVSFTLRARLRGNSANAVPLASIVVPPTE